MTRTLSSQESKLILSLEWKKQTFITTKEAKELLSVTDDHIGVILHRLVSKGWLSPVVRGVFEFIPAERGEIGFVDTNPYALGSLLVSPYTFAYSTAAYYWGLTTQASISVFLQTNIGKTHTQPVRGKPFRIIKVPDQYFFGIQNVDAYGTIVKITDIEKTVLDCVFHSEISGDIPEIASVIWNGKSQFDWNKFENYASRLNSKSVIQRLGYLLDLLKIETPIMVRKSFLQNIQTNKCYLGRISKWGKQGKLNTVWNIVVNIKESDILSEINVG